MDYYTLIVYYFPYVFRQISTQLHLLHICIIIAFISYVGGGLPQLKSSTVLGIVACTMALLFGLILVINLSYSIYELENFDYDEYYKEHGEYKHFESVGIDKFFARTFRNLGILVLASGLFGLIGTLLDKNHPHKARKFMILAAVISGLSIIGVIFCVLFIVSSSKIEKHL